MLSINPKAGFKFCWSMMVRTLAVVLLGRGAEATSSTSKLFVTEPSNLVKEEGYDHKDALFGVPPYGSSIQQQVLYVEGTDFCGAGNQLETGNVYPSRPDPQDTTPFILLLDRGGCTFVQKVRNAQHAGAVAVLIADNTCLCSDTEKECIAASTCQSVEPILADDGSGSDISIPTFMLRKPDADLMKQTLKGGETVQVEMTWDVPAASTDGVVTYDLWMTLADPNVEDFMMKFPAIAEALGDRAMFTPHYYIYDGIATNCRGTDGGNNVCYNLCTNQGRYCSTDPDDDLDHGVSGEQITVESLRRECIWLKYGASDGIGLKWWQYVAEFEKSCNSEKQFSDDGCIQDIYDLLSIDGEAIDACMMDAGGTEEDQPNSILGNLVADAKSNGIVTLPTMQVNGAPVRGQVSPLTALKAICAGYGESPANIPEVCAACDACETDVVECAKTLQCPPAPSIDEDLNIHEDNQIPPGDVNGLDSALSPGIPLTPALLQPVLDVASACDIDLQPALDQAIAMKSLDTQDMEDTANAVFGHVRTICSKEEEQSFHAAFDDFQKCSGLDLYTFLEEFPSAMVGTALKCVAYMSDFDLFGAPGSFPEECMDALFGQNPLGDALRSLLVKPGTLCDCLPPLHDSLPACTLDAWPIPLVGPWIRSSACLAGFGCNMLPDYCGTFMESLDRCLPNSSGEELDDCDTIQENCMNAVEDSAVFLALSPPFSGMPIPDICLQTNGEVGDVNLHVVSQRYNQYKEKCTTPWKGWDYAYTSLPSEDSQTIVKTTEPPRGSFGSFVEGFVLASTIAALCYVFAKRIPQQMFNSRGETYEAVQPTEAVSDCEHVEGDNLEKNPVRGSARSNGASKKMSFFFLALCLCLVAGKIDASSPLNAPRQPSFGRSNGSKWDYSKRPLSIRGGASSSKSKTNPEASKGSTITQSAFNLVNNVAGAGILALSAGQAAGTGWIPSMLICLLLGWISARTFVMVGEACELLNEKDFKGLWSKTVSKKTFVVDAMIAMLCLCMNVIYSGILGDVSTFLLGQTKLPPQLNKRSSNILITTISLLLPMSLIKDLSVLSFTSIFGFSAVMYTVFLIAYRALDGSYKLGTGRFLADGLIKALPSFTKESLWNVDFTSLILTSSLGLAYVCHYNSPIFYRQLENRSAKRFGRLTYISFAFIALLYMLVMGSGYSTFGEACMGNILLNYHPKDVLATFGRVATWFSILFGFPLVSVGAREGLINAAESLGFPQLGFEKNNFALVASILTLVTLVSCTVKDVSLVVNLTGALFGSFIVYLCPTIIYVRAVAIAKGKDSPEYRKARLWNYALLPFGTFIAALGVFVTIREQLSKASL